MLTESSNPTMAKKASEVAVVTAMKTPLSSGVSKTVTREKSALPCDMAKTATKMTSSRPDSSMQVSTTFALTLSPTPRTLTAATSSMKPIAITVVRAAEASMPKPFCRFSAKARAAVEAEVMPEVITVKATTKVRKWMPKARWVYSAAPAACGYLVTSSR